MYRIKFCQPDNYVTGYERMSECGENRKERMARLRIILFLLLLFLLPYASNSQNIVISIKGQVLVNGQPVKKGDNLSDNQKIVFGDPNAELKVLSQVGVCVIKSKNDEQKNTSELLELIKSTIRKNSVATLGTRAWTINPGKDEQLKLVEALCKTLNITSSNVNDLFSQYITPYCVLEFDKPYWQDIAQFLKTKYGFNPPRLTGELMTEDEYRTIPLVPRTRSLAPLPPEASLKKYCPIPGNQGEYGTCTGWASAYSARTISWAVKNNLTDVQDITNQAFSPSFVYSQVRINNDNNCQKGAITSKTVEVLKNVGAVFMTDLPYQCNPNIRPFMQQAKTYAIKDYQRLSANKGSLSKEEFDNIKRALAEKKPVLCSIDCHESFANSWGEKIWDGNLGKSPGGHAICMVGYDDKFNNGDGTLGAVEFINSWGVIWGDGGYIYVKYQDLPKILNYAISMYDDALPVPPPEQPEQPKQPEQPNQPEKPEQPKPLPEPPHAPDSMKRMEGSFSLILSNGTTMQLEGDESGFRNLKVVNAEKMTYNILNAYPSGTLFRISFTCSQPAYIYLISTDSKRSPLAQLFPDPDQNISALLDFKSEVSVSIPDETQYIAMDETPGEDYLCVIYSKDELDMDAITNSFQNNPGKSFIRIVKEALADKIVDDHEVTFQKDKIAFKTVSANHTAVPIFIKIRHA